MKNETIWKICVIFGLKRFLSGYLFTCLRQAVRAGWFAHLRRDGFDGAYREAEDVCHVKDSPVST